MRFVRLLAATVALACSGLAGQAQATQFFHYQIDWSGHGFGSYDIDASGSISFDRSTWHVNKPGALTAVDNVICTVSVGHCGTVYFAPRFLGTPSFTYDAISFPFSVSNAPPGSPMTGTGFLYQDNAFSAPGIYSSTTTHEQSTLTVSMFTDNLRPGVPEPSTWALMILGFGAIGAAMRRKVRESVSVDA